jgi:hypothetical protein
MAMSWFRSRAKGFSFFALFALSLQLALSFGHLHFDHGVTGPQQPSKIAAIDGATAPIATVHSDSQGLPEHNGDYCSICAVIHLARSLVLSPAPCLPLPARYTQTKFAPEDCVAAAGLGRTPFQARAPPIA